MRLTPADYAALEQSWITREIADAAGIFRVAHIEAKDILVRRNGSGNLEGLAFPYYWPGESHVLMHRIRLDEPIANGDGKRLKYLCAAGQRQHLYIPPGCPQKMLSDTSLPVIITEGEKKGLALLHYSGEKGMTILPIALGGVWNFRGTTGTETDDKGSRYQIKSPLPELDRIAWKGRKVTILYDSNASTNEEVARARRTLAAELMHRGARVLIANLPKEAGINGCDDYLAKHGPAKLDAVLEAALPYDWRAELIRNDNGKPTVCFANALTALRYAPEWAGVLAFDEFGMKAVALRKTPWGAVPAWSDQEDRRTCEWLQRNGIMVKIPDAGAAVQTVARDNKFHPVREYLESVVWDGTPRIDTWLIRYLSVEVPDTGEETNLCDYVRAIGAFWLISAVARVYDPGCKVDHCLVLEGKQGKGKSTALDILGGCWYTDDIADLSSKDAALGTRGKWIIEFGELDVFNRAEASRINAFITRKEDHIRPPYDRHFGDFPRECVFAGTVNPETYLKDETGARRFWPVLCGEVDYDALRRDRDQLWAEAAARYRRGDKWHLTETALIKVATEEQAARYDEDAWTVTVLQWADKPTQRFEKERPGDPETPIEPFTSTRESVVSEEILLHCIGLSVDRHDQRQKKRVSRILVAAGWKSKPVRMGTIVQRRYLRPDAGVTDEIKEKAAFSHA